MLVMNNSLRRSVAVGLAVCLLLLSALVYPQTVAHAAHHAHHKAATHATALCSWMCAAGQVLEGIQVVLQTDFAPILFAALPVFHEPCNNITLVSSSRGPPVFSI